MGSDAVVGVLGAINASVAALGAIAEVTDMKDSAESAEATPIDAPAGDPLRREADGWLDTLAEAAQLNAKVAALIVHAAAGFARTAQALAAPDESQRALEMSVTAEVACVLTISEKAAGALLMESQALTTALPLTLSALESGAVSWQHARVMVDETANLDQDGAAALEAHFLDPGAPNPARGCPAGELVPSRFRHKARTWGNATTRSVLKIAMPSPSRTGGCSTYRIGTGWRGFRPACLPIRPRGSGTGQRPRPGRCRAPMRAGP